MPFLKIHKLKKIFFNEQPINLIMVLATYSAEY